MDPSRSQSLLVSRGATGDKFWGHKGKDKQEALAGCRLSLEYRGAAEGHIELGAGSERVIFSWSINSVNFFFTARPSSLLLHLVIDQASGLIDNEEL